MTEEDIEWKAEYYTGTEFKDYLIIHIGTLIIVAQPVCKFQLLWTYEIVSCVTHQIIVRNLYRKELNNTFVPSQHCKPVPAMWEGGAPV